MAKKQGSRAGSPISLAQQAPSPRRPDPSWYKPEGQHTQHRSDRVTNWVNEVVQGTVRLPRFQRPYVWTDEQVLLLVDSLFHGFGTGTMLLWDRYEEQASEETFGDFRITSAPGSRMMVVDGQQRLTAVVTATLSGRFWFDLQTGVFSVGDAGPWRAPMAVLWAEPTHDGFDWLEEHAATNGLDVPEVRHAWSKALWMLRNSELNATILPYRWTLDRVLETFRRINTTGTPMDPKHLEEALRRAGAT